MKLSELIDQLEVIPTTGRQKKKRPDWSKDPNKRGKGLWIKSAFDLVIAKEGCMYGKKYQIRSDKEVEGFAQTKEVKICNECIFLQWDDGYICSY